jgi:hypothetical protein
MTQRGRHRAPARHARAKGYNVPLTSAIVAGAALLLTGGITAANSQEQAPPYIDATALANDSSNSSAKDLQISNSVVTEKVKLDFATAATEDATIATGTDIVEQAGRTGLAEITYQVKFLAGVEVARVEISRVITKKPIKELVIRGVGDPTEIAKALSTAEDNTGSALGNKAYANLWIKQKYGWDDKQFSCLETLWFKESNWNHKATNSTSGAYGIPQSLPGNKMASFGSDWRTNPATQIKWGANYIQDRYDTPCGALDFFYAHNWY